MLGRLDLERGDAVHSERVTREAVAVARRDGDLEVEGRAHLRLAAALRRQGRFDEAHALRDRALTLSLSIPDPRLQRTIEKAFTRFLPESDEARRWIDGLASRLVARAAEARAGGDRRGEAAALEIAGNAIARGLWDGDRAVPVYERALEAWQSAADSKGQARVLYLLAFCHRRGWRQAKALDYYARALKLQRDVGDRAGEAESLMDLGYLYRRIGDPTSAVAPWRRAAEIFEQWGDDDDRAQMEVNLAELEIENEAVARLERALRLFLRAGNPRGVAAVYQDLGHHAVLRGDRSAALRLFGQARELYHKVGNRMYEPELLRLEAAVHQDSGELDEALRCTREAVAIARGANAREQEAASLLLLATLLRDRTPGFAILHGKQAINVYQSLRADNVALTPDLRVKLTASLAGAYRTVADILAENRLLGEAQEVLELLKQEELEQMLRRSKPSSAEGIPLTPTQKDVDKRYEDALGTVTAAAAAYAALSGKATRTPEEEARLAALRADVEHANREFARFLAAMEKDLGPVLARVVHDEVRESRGLMKILPQLGEGTVAVTTIVGDRALRIILVTAGVMKGFDVPISSAELSKQVLALSEALKDRRLDPRPPALAMYRTLVEPIAKDLDGARALNIMWSLDGPLRYVPVAALWDGERWLVERYATSLLTRGSQSRLLEPPKPNWVALALGVTEPHAGLPALPGVREEIREVVGDGEGHGGVLRGRTLLDGAFTRDRLVAALEERRPVVHVASHYVLQRTRPEDTEAEGSYLLLGDGGHLTLSEIDALPDTLLQPIDLIALSACETAAARDSGDGAEMDGLAAVAQQKGASAVLATLWPVSDGSTPSIMRRFYELRGDRGTNGFANTKARALQVAQREMARNDRSGSRREPARGVRVEGALPAAGEHPAFPGWTHPFFWAPFVLIGNWR
jgi:CHAT domain-containing protein